MQVKTRFFGRIRRMKDIITLIIAGLALMATGIVFDDAHSADLPREFSMKTETGEIVLTKEPCEFIKMGLQNYPYAAYATESGHANHEGCWRMDDIKGMRSVLIYFPEIDATGVYNPELFGPRLTPSVKLEPRFENNKAMIYYEVWTF
jgi:hypothetical protein